MRRGNVINKPSQFWLQRCGWGASSDGQDALAILYTENWILWITDWNMPNMNGLGLTKSNRNDATFGTFLF